MIQSEKAIKQRVAAAIVENGEDMCLDDPQQEEALPEANSAVNTR